MERLTARTNGVLVYIGPECDNPATGDIPAELNAGAVRYALNRLAAYEDTELEPEEIEGLLERGTPLEGGTAELMKKYLSIGSVDHLMELAQAEKEGRLVVLPCKIGDLLYEIDTPEYGVITCEAHSISYYNGPMFHVPGNKVVNSLTVEVEVIEGHGKGSCYNFELDDFGETVFLTQEAAEETLRKEAENG